MSTTWYLIEKASGEIQTAFQTPGTARPDLSWISDPQNYRLDDNPLKAVLDRYRRATGNG